MGGGSGEVESGMVDGGWWMGKGDGLGNGEVESEAQASSTKQRLDD